MNGDYPLGAKYDPRAPYNQEENPEVELEVCISVTYHRTSKIKVKDYKILEEGKGESGEYYCYRDFTNCDLVSAVENQVDLSNISERNGWTQDELEVIVEHDT